MRDDEDGIAEEGQGHGQREPLEDSLLRWRDVVVDRLLDKVAGGVGCGQRLASRAGGGRFGDVGVGVCRGDAAEGEGGQEEDQHKQRVGILQHGEDVVQGGGMLPAWLLGVQLAVVQLGGHGASGVRSARSCARLAAVEGRGWVGGGEVQGQRAVRRPTTRRRLHTPCCAEG